MKEVLIDDIIGYDWWTDSGITAENVRKQLEGLADGEEVNITVNSPGGSIYECIVIFNLIRDTAKTHPVSVRVNCMAMSAASYIALAARTVNKDSVITVSENSVVAIHNPYSFIMGDYRELRKEADYLEKLSAVYASVHAAVTGKTEKEIREAMDAETFYVGREIIEWGFANKWEAITDGEENAPAPEGREKAVLGAKAAFEKSIEKIRGGNKYDLGKIAALFDKNIFGAGPRNKNQETPGEEPAGSGGKMTPEELMSRDKDCYEAVFALGESAALEKERKRVAAHLTLGKKSGAMEIAVKHIENGKSALEEDVNAEYVAAAMDKSRIDARQADNPGDILSGGGQDDAAKIDAAFKLGAAGKDLKGASWDK
jgi:ATP-dependent protease ClpP protease subunit